MMKVVHVIIGLNVGGAELMLKRLVESKTRKADLEHVVISLTDMGVFGEELSRGGVKVFCLGMYSLKELPTVFFKLRRLIKKLKPDVVQTWMYHSDLIGGLAAKTLNVKQVFWNVRNTKLSGRGVSNYVFRRTCALFSYLVPDNVVYVSNSAKKAHVAAGYSRKKSLVINNGFDLKVLSYCNDSRVKLRGEWGVSSNDFLVCSIGRYAKAKDHISFIRAIKRAVFQQDRIRAVIVGKGILGNKKILDEIDGFKDNFILLDSRSDIPSVLSACDLFCLHSITEGFPNVLGEAMSIGLPCITTRAGDAELILNDISLTCNVGDVQDISRKILNIFNMQVSERKALGERNRNRVSQCYSLSSVVDKYLKLYGL